MLIHRNQCTTIFLPELPGASKWIISPQTDIFGGILFPTMEIVEQSPDNGTTNWDRYLELRPQLIDLEASLAGE
jgi:hypothetical protein